MAYQRKVLFYLYVLFNVFYTFIFINRGRLGGDFNSSLYVTDDYLIIVSLFLILSCFFIVLIVFFNFAEKISVKVLPENKMFMLDFIIFLVCIFYLYSIKVGIGVNGINSVSKNNLNVSSFHKYIYALVQPSFLIIIYLFYRCKDFNYLYLLISIIFFGSSIITGESVNLIFIWPLLYLSNAKKKYTKVVFMYYLVAGICVYPLFRMLKFMMLSVFLSGNSVSISSLLNSYDNFSNGIGFIGLYFSMLDAAFERFQVVANMQYILGNEFAIKAMYNYFPSNFLNEYFITNFIYKVLTGIDAKVEWLQGVVAYSINGNEHWNTHVSMLGLFFVQGISSIPTYILMFLVLFFSVILSKKIGNNIIDLTWIYVLLLFIHGWFVSYVIFAQSLMLFYSLILLTKFFRLSK